MLEIGCLLFKDGVCIDSQHVKLESKRIKTVEIRTKLVPVKLCDFCQAQPKPQLQLGAELALIPIFPTHPGKVAKLEIQAHEA